MIPALDVDTIYEVPLRYHEEGFDREVLRAFRAADASASPISSRWTEIVARIRSPEGEVQIAVVGKYTHLLDAYKSLAEALTPWRHRQQRARQLELDRDRDLRERQDGACDAARGVHGILVPGGFGERGAEGKIAAVRFARERKVPYFGICFGMQMAVIEAARNLVRHRAAPARPSSGRRRAGGRPADRMDARQRAGAPRRSATTRRHDAARRL